MWKRFCHYLFGCEWVYGPGSLRRACPICHRRQVVTFRSQYCESWSDHTYPLDADPTKDPTVVCIDDFVSTLGAEAFMRQVFSKEKK
jgi:hypothetical protein